MKQSFYRHIAANEKTVQTNKYMGYQTIHDVGEGITGPSSAPLPVPTAFALLLGSCLVTELCPTLL